MISLFLEDSTERVDLAENQLGKLRAKNRSTVSASRTSPAVSEYLITIKKNDLNIKMIYFSVTFGNQL